MEKPFVIYRSSAGSGKTFTLALEYLKLAFRAQGSYRSILAVTFTNKATKEMKTRIIDFLYDLSRGNGKVVREILLEDTQWSSAELTEKAGVLLTQILHGYSYFSVMTIDSFFQKVIRAFAREIGLHAGFMLELDQYKVLDEVVDHLMLDIGKPEKEQLTTWLTRFAEERVESGKAWDFKADIKSLAMELLKENYKVQLEHFGGNPTDRNEMGAIQDRLKEIQSGFEETMQRFGQTGLHMIHQAGLSVNDFSYKASGPAGFFANLAELKSVEPGKRARQAAEEVDSWTSKKAPLREEITRLVEGGLQHLMAEAILYFDERGRDYFSAQQLQKFIYTYGILKDLEVKLDDYKRDNELMLISDASVFLRKVIAKDDTPFVYEKMGTSYQHFLIDEFQDTSGMQWNNFRPLIENSLDAGHANLVVGDVKQAIYRWRGGDWQLLLERIEQDIQSWRSQVKNLDRNYRSKKNIVDFNNTMYRVLPALMEEEMLCRLTDLPEGPLLKELLNRIRVIRKAYEDAYQELPSHYNTDDLWQGHINFKLYLEDELMDEEGNKVDWKEKVLESLPLLVESLQDQGYALRDIAFLVRNKREGKMVADCMMNYQSSPAAKKDHQYEVISPESLFLESSLSVGLLVDILRYLDNPMDMLAKGNILYKYHKLQHDTIQSDELHALFLKASGIEEEEGENDPFMSALPPAFRSLSADINKYPLYEMVESLISLFQLNDGKELAYLQTFQDTVLEYTRSEKGDLSSFLGWWDDQGSQTSIQISEQLDAMRILTIHKSKGLQFKVVILPFCDWSLDHHATQNNIIWTYTQEPPFDTMGLMPMKYSKSLINTVFSRDYYDEMLRAHLDNLNLLYVATTRAEECLYGFARPKSSGKKIGMTSISNALFHALSTEKPSSDDMHKRYLNLSEHWTEETGEFIMGYEPYAEKVKESREHRMNLSYYPSERWRERLMVRPASRKYFVRQEENMQINLPLLVKEVLLKIKSRKAIEEIVEEVYLTRGLTAEAKQNLSDLVKEVLEQKTIKPFFSEPFDQVILQQPLYSGRGYFTSPDRLMVWGKKAAVIYFCSSDEALEKKVSISLNILKKAGYQAKGYILNIPDQLLTEVDAQPEVVQGKLFD